MPFNLATASDRSLQTIHASAVFQDHAPSIAVACADASPNELVVAAVSADHEFRGIWTVPRSELSALVAELDDGGWSLVFASGTGLAQVDERCLKLARMAFARWEAMRRWASKHR